jgi:Uncharacterised nucleotidyltransferase
MVFSPEFRLLLLACRLDDQESQVVQARKVIEENRVNWPEVFERAGFHGIRYQLADLLEKVQSPVTDTDVREKLGEEVRENLLRQLRHVAEFFRIRDMLDRERITIIPFKGFWTGEEMYGDLSRRESFDIDLFIDIKDLERIKPLMAGDGYLMHQSVDELTDEHITGELAEYNFEKFSGETCIFHVEFHWRSTRAFYWMDIGLDDLRSQVVTGTLQGRELLVFSPAASLLLTVMHHGGKECYWKLRQILDIAHILRKHPGMDTAWLFRQAEKYHVTTLLFLGVRLASELTGVDIPPEFRKGVSSGRFSVMAGRRVSLMERPVVRLKSYNETLASWIFKIRSRDGSAIKAHLIRHTLRKVVAPRMVPPGWRHHFFDRSIRKANTVSNEI